MNDRQITVQILGDAASLERAFAKSSASARTFEGQVAKSSRGAEKELGRIERGALAGSGAFHGLGRSVAFASTAFLGAAGFVAVLKSSVDVVLQSQASIAKLDQAITNAHASVKALTPILEEHAAAARKLGFDDDQTREAEAKLVTAFGATKKSLDELKVAEDLARSTHVDLGTATRQLILLQEGNTRAAKQFGLALPDLTKAEWQAKAAADGLNVSQEKGKTLYDELLPRIKDQAKAFADSPAGKIAEFHAEIQHLQESIGTGLLPVVNKYLTEVDDWLAKGSNQKRVTDDVKKVVDELASVLGDAKKAVQDVIKVSDPFVKAIGGWKTVIEGLIALKFATVIAGWRTGLLSLGDASVMARLGLLGGSLSELLGLYQDYKTHGAAGYLPGPGFPGLQKQGSPFARILGAQQAAAATIYGPTLAQGGRVQGHTGVITTGLAAVEKFAGGHVNDDFATGGHAANSYHYQGEAADLAVDPAVWARLYANRGAFAELFGPWGLYHNGVQFYDAKLQKQHMDHIHVAYTGGPQLIDKMMAGAGAGSAYGPPQTSGGGGGGSGSTKKTPWKGATQATIITAQGQVAAMLKGIPRTLDPVEQNAVDHIEALKKKLVPHMTAADYATTEVELRKWGKKLHDEISKNAKVAAAAAAEAKKTFDRALSLDVSHILRDFDRQFAATKSAYDKATAAGLAGFASPVQTPEEKALADFIAKRAAADQAKSRASQLANAATPEEAAALTLGFSLDDQQAALEASAAASRTAADKKATADQQAYQDQRDAQWQGMQDINDDQRIALQNHLDDLGTSLAKHLITWKKYLADLRALGIDTNGLIDPYTGQQGGALTTSTGQPFTPGSLGDQGYFLLNPAVAPPGGSSAAVGGSRTLTVVVPLSLDGNEVARVVTPHIPLQVRVNI